jgi:nucleoside 2-deoxyribosyltransferase
MKLYLAGPMTGIEEYNYPAFFAAADELRRVGFVVANPADHGVIEGYEWADYLRMDLKTMLECEGVATLDGWEDSKGASLEVHVARALGWPVMAAWRWMVRAGQQEVMA